MGILDKDKSDVKSSTAEETWYAKDIELRERFHEQDAAALAEYQTKYLAAMQENSDAIRSLDEGGGGGGDAPTEAGLTKFFMGSLLSDWGSASRNATEVLETAKAAASAYLQAFPQGAVSSPPSSRNPRGK